MTNLRARTSTRPASTVNLSRKFACAWITRTPSPVIALDGVVRRDRRDHAMHVVMHAAMVDLRLDDVDAEIGGRAHGVGPLAGGQQRFGGHAAIIETVPAHAPLFDEHHGYAELGRRRRDRQAP